MHNRKHVTHTIAYLSHQERELTEQLRFAVAPATINNILEQLAEVEYDLQLCRWLEEGDIQ